MFKQSLDEDFISISINKVNKKYELLKDIKSNIHYIYKNTPIDENNIDVNLKKNIDLQQIKKLCSENKLSTNLTDASTGAFVPSYKIIKKDFQPFNETPEYTSIKIKNQPVKINKQIHYSNFYSNYI